MCGLIASNDKAIDVDRFSRALHTMEHRGVESPKWEKYNEAMVGHVALPLCSLDPVASYQPVHLFSFVGEIFNYKEFDEQALNDVQMIRNLVLNNPDSEVLNQLHNMDGFWAITYIRNDQLIAINDYLSQKPIYYRTDLNVVASEIDALKRLGPTSIDELFMSNIQKWGYDPTGRTPWDEIKQMPPGSIYIDGQIHSYWDWSKIESPYDVRTGVYQAMRARIHVARPLSLLLSGGLDSSIVYTVAKDLGAEIEVFHVENDESEFADLITKDRTDLDIRAVTDDDAVRIHQSPVDLGSVKPQIALAKAIKAKGYHVVLTGDGADELFGGYRRSKDYDSQLSDTFLELPYYHLPKLDRTMMKSTIEVRSPFLAPYLVKYAMELPYKERIDKKHLKEAFASDIPYQIIEREKVPLKTEKIRESNLLNTQSNITEFRWGKR